MSALSFSLFEETFEHHDFSKSKEKYRTILDMEVTLELNVTIHSVSR